MPRYAGSEAVIVVVVNGGVNRVWCGSVRVLGYASLY